ncbi:HD domain-containing protein [Streptomyces sp. ID38640]|uniref:HD domain-containing protein n=1 Tax=Streptomyces sp. ID38640 TaxID=1265399 RepID=UPI00287FB510|nr:HD domain-containing protein [Streptomyces sp. ID38640]
MSVPPGPTPSAPPRRPAPVLGVACPLSPVPAPVTRPALRGSHRRHLRRSRRRRYARRAAHGRRRPPDRAPTGREATELNRDVADDLIYHHSRHVHLFGARHGRHHGLDVDPELLYAGALFHDLGLPGKFRTSQLRFELDGADEART